ncbi:hypothetical protein ACFOY8_05675 [Thalassospira xianhensis]|uniref:hypothetical protein n=1 Tax=Thalassospira xianhensis TaxID=478503 RepID=UPI0011BFE691|nr:hypothetical protein [Thalassospira xianhensis]
MPRISRPELRLHRIGWLGLAMVPMVHSEMPRGRSSMAGGVPALRQRLRPWGEVRLRCPSKAGGVCSGQRGLGEVGLVQSGSVPFRPVLSVQPTRSVAFGDVEGQQGWLAGLAWRWIKIVIPGRAERRAGIHAPLKETGFPPSRE